MADELCKVEVGDDRVLRLLLPNGEYIYGQTALSIEQKAGGDPFYEVTVKVFVHEIVSPRYMIAPLITSELDEKSKTWLRDIPDHANNTAKTEGPPLDS